MTAGEAGFLLLTSTLGDPARKVLTDAQLRKLAKRVSQRASTAADRELCTQDLITLGYNPSDAERIVHLLSQQEQLRWYLQRAKLADVFPITRVSDRYPLHLRKRMGLDSPGCLWAKGDISLLRTPMIGLVGSRELRPENREFAREAGRQAARQGYTLVSGNARGADRQAQEACLSAGGRVICVVAGSLAVQPLQRSVLYLSEEGFDLCFTPQRALHRNRVIHALSQKVFVAQCSLGKGGTWSGTVSNLKEGYSPVYCFRDGSDAVAALEQLGVTQIGIDDLCDLSCLKDEQSSLWD